MGTEITDNIVDMQREQLVARDAEIAELRAELEISQASTRANRAGMEDFERRLIAMTKEMDELKADWSEAYKVASYYDKIQEENEELKKALELACSKADLSLITNNDGVVAELVDHFHKKASNK